MDLKVETTSTKDRIVEAHNSKGMHQQNVLYNLSRKLTKIQQQCKAFLVCGEDLMLCKSTQKIEYKFSKSI